MYCEICGRNEAKQDAVVEGAIVGVCDNCSRYGKVVPIKTKEIEVSKPIPKKLPEEEILEFVIPNYSEKIKTAREKLGLKQKELAEKIHEKESLIHKLESAQLIPDLKLAKKLENALKIRLVETYKQEYNKNLNFKSKSLTIGDLVKIKEKKTI